MSNDIVLAVVRGTVPIPESMKAWDGATTWLALLRATSRTTTTAGITHSKPRQKQELHIPNTDKMRYTGLQANTATSSNLMYKQDGDRYVIHNMDEVVLICFNPRQKARKDIDWCIQSTVYTASDRGQRFLILFEIRSYSSGSPGKLGCNGLMADG